MASDFGEREIVVSSTRNDVMRGMTISLAMIFIASACVSLAAAQHLPSYIPSLYERPSSVWRVGSHGVLHAIHSLNYYAVQCAITASLFVSFGCIVVAKHRDPEILRDSGVLSNQIVAILAIRSFGIRLLFWRISWHNKFYFSDNYNHINELIVSSLDETLTTASTGVLACWLTLILTGRFRTRSNWLNRLGQVVALYWVLMNFMPR